MRMNTKSALAILLMVIAMPLLLVQGCGQPAAEDQGCPDGTFLANASDVITASPGTDITYESFFLGGTTLFPPITFIVTDASGPRNNICLIAYTGDTSASPGPFWYTDATYSAYIFGTGPLNARAIVTDDTGVAKVYWSTADLPPSNPRVVTGGTPTAPTYTAGADQTGTSWIHVYSGSAQAVHEAKWTVKGEPAQ